MGLEGTYSCRSISCTPFNIPLIRLIAVDCVLCEEASESTYLTEIIYKIQDETFLFSFGGFLLRCAVEED